MQQKTDAVKRVEEFLKREAADVKLIKLSDTARSAKDAALALNTDEGSIILSPCFSEWIMKKLVILLWH